MKFHAIAGAFVVSLGLAAVSHADVTLTDIQSYSDAGGVWNNDNGTNWGIWIQAGNNPATIPYPFLNDTSVPGALGNKPVVIPDGTHTYVMFRDPYATTDLMDYFMFSGGTLSLAPDLAYIPSSATAPTGTAGPVTIGGQTVSISGFGWYAPGAFGVDWVGQGEQNTPNGIPDLVGFVTFTVTPEPASLGLLGVGSLSLLARRRRA